MARTTHQPTPPPRPTPRRRRKQRVSCLGCLGRVAFASILFVVAFTALLILIYLLAPPPRRTFLVLGLDARPGEGVVTRTDTLILVTVDPAQPYVGMLSIPRDLYVQVPGYGPNRINTAHILGENTQAGGGPSLAVETVKQNFGVPVDGYVRLNFEGFVAIIDAAGGVDIEVKYAFIDYEYPTPDYGTMTVEFQAGLQHMDGSRALQYARVRHGASDIERAERQQQVVQALAASLVRPENMWRWPEVYATFIQYVDTDLNPLDMVSLAPALLWVGPGGIDRRVLDHDMVQGITTSSGAAVLEPRWDQINPLLDEMFWP